MRNKKFQKGLSLIEIAIGIIILGILISGMTLPLAAQMQTRQLKENEAYLEQIREALLGYVIQHGVLPCPSLDQNGIAASNCLDWSETQGFLPWKTLQVRAKDAWQTAWMYRANRAFVNAAQPIYSETVPDTTLPIQISDLNGDPLHEVSQKNLPCFVVISAGKNQRFDGENQNHDAIYHANIQTPNFDDQTIWSGSPQLFYYLTLAGKI